MSNEYNSLLEISKEDLEASKLLFRNDMYPQSLFYFQQSAEKLTKFVGLKQGVIEKNDLLKKISHNASLIFKKAIEKYQAQFPQNVDFDTDHVFLEIKNFIYNNSNEVVLEFVQNQINQTLNDKPNLPFGMAKMETAEDLCSVLRQIDPNNPDIKALEKINDDLVFKPIIDKMMKDFVFNLGYYIKGVTILFIINTLSDKLVTSVRYPAINDMRNPSEKYNIRHPMVEFLPKFHDTLQFCVKTIEEFEKK